MAIPFRLRATMPGNSAPWMRDGTGERLLWSFGLLMDARLEKIRQGINNRMPVRRNPYDRNVVIGIPQADALAVLGDDLQIPRGLTESDLSYAFRLHRALDSHRHGGTARGVLMQLLGYLLAYTPAVRWVSTRYDRTTSPPTRLGSRWDAYPAGRDPNAEPVTVRGTAGGVGDWEWDDLSQITGSLGTWSGYCVVYAVAPNDWCHRADPWGTGSTYTPAANGRYSTISGTAYILAGSYIGTSKAWGSGSTYTPAANGRYSTISGGKYVLAGQYAGTAQAWGVDVTADVGRSIQRIEKQFKHGNTWVRTTIVAFNASEFDPAQAAGGGVNPDGYWGRWSKVGGTAYTDSRFTDARYGGEVV